MKFKYIYGPVSSWRLGASLGIDLLSQKGKACNFNCVYCQLGRAGKFSRRRRTFVDVGGLLKELSRAPDLKIDYITFSGAGEPTLAKNLGPAIRAVKKLGRAKIAVITNASLLSLKGVRRDLQAADLVVIKLDAPCESLLRRINRPAAGIKLAAILKGIKKFRAAFGGRLALQIMFVKENQGYAQELAALANRIGPDEVQLNTPLRPSAARPLPRKELAKIKEYFIRVCQAKIKISSVYDAPRKKAAPMDRRATLRRRGIEIAVVILAVVFLSSCAAPPVKQPPAVYPAAQPPLPAQSVVIPRAPDALREDIFHTVAPSETIWRICKMYDVKMADIARANNLSNPAEIEMGQRLLIPQAAPIRPVISLYPANKWRYIVIHHSATDEGNALAFHKLHRIKGWETLGYHFVIDNGSIGKKEGNIEASGRWIKQQNGAHCKAAQMNYRGIGVCLVGNFNTEEVSPGQMDSLVYLVNTLRRYYNIPPENIIGHGQAPGARTDCPGKRFPWGEFRSRLRAAQ